MIKFAKKMIEKHPTLWEVFKFLIVGGLATIIDFVVMGAVLYAFDTDLYSHNFFNAFISDASPKTIATIIGTASGFAVSLVFNYLLSIFFVYSGTGNSTKKAKSLKGGLLFTLLAIIGLGIHMLGMYIGYDLIGINEWIVKIILTIVVLVFNYITRKKLIFKKELTQTDTILEQQAH